MYLFLVLDSILVPLHKIIEDLLSLRLMVVRPIINRFKQGDSLGWLDLNDCGKFDFLKELSVVMHRACLIVQLERVGRLGQLDLAQLCKLQVAHSDIIYAVKCLELACPVFLDFVALCVHFW